MDEISHRAGARKRLPNRRGAIAFELEHGGHRFRAHVGCFANVGHALRRSPNGVAASLIGAAVDRLSALEKAP